MLIAENKLAQLDNWYFVAVAFVDFRKAFDTVDWKLLTQIVEFYDFR